MLSAQQKRKHEMADKDNGKFKILGFAGSLRKGSFNKMLLRAAVEVAPEGAALEVFDLEGIPPFNQDLENTPHEKVKELLVELTKWIKKLR
jgi:NAD(P)H-dependent FMN reductase